MAVAKLIDVASPGNETYCGTFSLLIGIFLFPCICFCPIDQRPIGSGAKVDQDYEY
jgi:hypothetical protein